MKVFEAILLAILSSSLIVIFAMGYQHSIIVYLRMRIKRYRAKKCIKKLEQAGYFNLTPRGKMNSSKKGLINACQSCNDFKQIWNCLNKMEFDYRSFILKFDKENNELEIDVVHLNKTLAVLDMEMVLQKPVQENKEIFSQNILLNGSKYSIIENRKDLDFDKKVLMKFSDILNKELANISSDERIYHIGDSTNKMVFLTPQLHKLIM